MLKKTGFCGERISPENREKRRCNGDMRNNVVFVGVLVVIAFLLIGAAGLKSMGPSPMELRHTITVDGDPSDWSGVPPSENNTYSINSGEYIWKDAVNDERNDFNGSSYDTRVDLTQFRITGDSNYIYFMAEFKDLTNGSSLYLGENGDTWMAITIDNGTAGGATYFAGDSDTQCNSSAGWEYQIVVNLADSRYTGKEMRNTSMPLNESTANWGSIFYVVNSSWDFIDYAGDTGQYGLMSVNMTLNTIEIKLAWSVIGINPANAPTLNISVITARGYSDYASDAGHTWDISGASDALDCITTTGPNTWDEVQDGVVNDYITVTFDSLGDVTEGTFIPEFNFIFLSALILLVVSPVIKRRSR